MGGGFSNETAKAEEEVELPREDALMYKLVDMHGGGELIRLIRIAKTTGDHTLIDAFLETGLKDYLYNQGKGKLFAVPELVKIRNKERNAKLGAFTRKKGKGKSGPNVLDEIGQDMDMNAGDLKKALKLLDGGGKGGRSESKYRDLAWKLEQRGSMGETLVGVCLLQASTLHNLLVLKLIDMYPKLINDICISEDYYGLSPLHQAIINQDPEMASKLLRKGADVNQRCFGSFFCAEDQRASRTDSLEHEFVELSRNTNYTGSMYYGEYPLSFAVCMNQIDMFRLLLAKKANLNAQDTNGNTVLHLCVIHENMEMLRHLLDAGASLRIANVQNLTPLTLAAKLARKKMFNTILELECERIWVYGESSCTAYPLTKIDTISQEKGGDMNDDSALSLVVYGGTQGHLELLDGLLEKILEAKWKAFAKMAWMKSFWSFLFYYIIFLAAFMLRPFSATTEQITDGLINSDGLLSTSNNDLYFENETFTWDDRTTQCHLLEYRRWPLPEGYIRLGCELTVVLSVLVQLIMDIRDVRRIGKAKWFSIMRAFPAKLLFKLTFLIVLSCIPVRLACSLSPTLLVVDNTLALVAVLLTTMHFLYYCRAIKFVGPFVLMVYTIITTDLTRFLIIYSIFLIGFSQSFYVIFTACERADTLNKIAGVERFGFQNIIQTPTEAFIRTFIMTIGEFSNTYRMMAMCQSNLMRTIGKIIFLIFELFVSIMQLNLLIAMMTRTYETIFQTRKEWKRQWAQVILMLELSLSPSDRWMHHMKYSRPTGTNRQIRSYVVVRKSGVGLSELTEEEEKRVKTERAEQIREEKRQLMKKKQREQEMRENTVIVFGGNPPKQKWALLRQQTLEGKYRL